VRAQRDGARQAAWPGADYYDIELLDCTAIKFYLSSDTVSE
jgi:hypothetical protein